MSDPVRLRDDPITPKSRQRLLRLGSDDLDVGFDPDRGLARFKASIESGSGVRAKVSRPALFAPWPKAWRYAAGPALWLCLTLPAAAAAGWWAIHHAPAVWQHLHAPQTLPNVAPPAPAPPPASTPSSTQQGSSIDQTAADERPVEIAPTPGPVAAKKAAVSDEARDRQLAAETEQLAELRRIAPSDPRRALTLADEGAHQFPNGFFSQEREAIAITALLRLGRDAEARARADRFLARYPRGPAAEKIRKSVGLTAN